MQDTTEKHRQRLPQGSPLCASQFDTLSCLTQSVTSAVHNEQFNYLLKTKIGRRGLTKDCLSCVHARCGFIINTLRKKTVLTGDVRKDDEYCVLCSSAAAAVAIGHLQLQLSHHSLVALQAFCFPKCDF